MDVEIIIDASYKTPKLVLYTKEVTKELADLVSRLGNGESKLILGFNEGEVFIISPQDLISVYTENQYLKYGYCDKVRTKQNHKKQMVEQVKAYS